MCQRRHARSLRPRTASQPRDRTRPVLWLATACGRFGHGPLKRIVERGFRIRIEAIRPNHDHSVGTLFVHFVSAAGAKTLRENCHLTTERCAFDQSHADAGRDSSCRNCDHRGPRLAWPPMMRVYSESFSVSTRGKGTYEITDKVESVVRESGVICGDGHRIRSAHQL